MADDFLFVLSKGFNEPGVVKTTFMLAAISAMMDMKTTVFCFQDAVEILVKGALDKEEKKEGIPTMKQRLREAIEAGVEILACSQALAIRNLKEEDLIEDVKVVGAGTFIFRAMDAKRIVCIG